MLVRGRSPDQIHLLAGNLAAHYLKRNSRTYRSLSVPNKSFDTISRHCWRLEQLGLMPIVAMSLTALSANCKPKSVMLSFDRMHGVEDEDMFRFGQTRIKREHYLNPARPVSA